MGQIHVAEWGEAALNKLRTVISDIKSTDSIAPITVITPNYYSGLALRRVSAYSQFCGDDTRGIVNTQFIPIRKLIADLGTERLIKEGRRSIRPEVTSEALRRAISVAIEEGSPLKALACNSSTERAFMRLMTELDECPESVIEKLATEIDIGGERSLASWSVSIWREYRKAISRYHDFRDLAMAAAQRIKSDPDCLRNIGEIVLYCPLRISPLEWAVLEVAAHTGKLHAILGISGESHTDLEILSLRNSLAGLGLELSAADETPDVSGRITEQGNANVTGIITAPDAREEVRAAVQMVIQALERGERLYRKAIVYVVEDPYSRLLRDFLDQVGIPYSGNVSEPLRRSAAGRILLGALSCSQTEYDRSNFIEWLSSGPVVEAPRNKRVPVRKWDQLSRLAGVISGKTEWYERLEELISKRQAELLGIAIETSKSRRQATEFDLEALERLRQFFREFAETAGIFEPGVQASWREFASTALVILDRYTGGEQVRLEWPEGVDGVHLRAYERIRELLTALWELDEFRSPITSEIFHQALLDLLDLPSPHVHRFGDGIFVGKLSDAVAADFESIYVLGCSSKNLPGSRQENSLISDTRRGDMAKLTSEWPVSLPRGEYFEALIRREFLAALRSASRDRVISHPVGNFQTGREEIPSQWLLAEASQLASRSGSKVVIGAADFKAPDPLGPWHLRLRSYSHQLTSTSFVPVLLDDLELRELIPNAGLGASILDTALPSRIDDLKRGITSQLALHDPYATEYFGFVGKNYTETPGSRPVSPTALETWATCPYRYFLERVLNLDVIERPEAVENISPKDRGSLVHRILERFHQRHLDKPAGECWTQLESDELLGIAEEEFHRCEGEGITGWPFNWDIEKGRIRRLLRKFLEADTRFRKHFGVATRVVELGFGTDEDASLPPVQIRAGNFEVKLRGRVDRFDNSDDQEIGVIIDYKTGGNVDSFKQFHKIKLNRREPLPSPDELDISWYSDDSEAVTDSSKRDPSVGGTLLQLPLYALGGQLDARSKLAIYWHLDFTTGESTGYGYRLSPSAMDRVFTVVTEIVSGIVDGVFPLNPGTTSERSTRVSGAANRGKNCAYCYFDAVCPVDRTLIAKRKSSAGEYFNYYRLAEPDMEAVDG